MDGSSFDRITRRLAVATSRRGGVAALVAGALGIAGISAADAVVPVPPICRSTGSECTDGAQCCSGRCVMKSDGFSRCARTTSNRPDKKKDKKKKKHGETCRGEEDFCNVYAGENCCTGLFCCGQAYNGDPSDKECVTCAGLNDYCSSTEPGGGCCDSDQLCDTMHSGSDTRCCIPTGNTGCANDFDCCGYQKPNQFTVCASGTCLDN